MFRTADVHDCIRSTARRGARLRVLAALALAAASASCGKMVREGQASSFLIVNEMVAAAGAKPTEFGGTLFSDVETVVNDVPTIFSDVGRVTFSLGMKDPGSASAPTQPTSANFITVNRYHVKYIRSDGQARQGIDVPYEFDGAFTATVSDSNATAGFEIVRHLAKEEAPLAALKLNRTIINTIAEVTFYGRDQTGREVSAMARLNIEFGNFGDPQ